MKIVINNLNSQYQETISLENFENIHKTLKKLSSIREPLEAKIFAINEFISSDQLLQFKNNFNKHNICSLLIYSNNRDTVLAAKSLKINSEFVKEKEARNKLLLPNSKIKDDVLFKRTVRSGDRISSNGNLFIIGDVNPGAMVSAKKNIYVWGKLLGIAFAGKGENNNACIASLYLNPLQLRIGNLIAIGPKNKPQDNYPEIALIEKKSIIIKPYIIESKN